MILLVAVVGVWLFGGTVVICLNSRAVLYKEFYLHLFGMISRKESALYAEFNDFCGMWTDQCNQDDHAPKIQTREETLRWMGLGTVRNALRECPHIVSGIDPWGQPLIFKITAFTAGNETELTVVVRSVGVNGRDEGGKGDDIQSHCAPQTFVQWGGP